MNQQTCALDVLDNKITCTFILIVAFLYYHVEDVYPFVFVSLNYFFSLAVEA